MKEPASILLMKMKTASADLGCDCATAARGGVRSAGRCTADRRMPGGTGSISTTASQIVGERVQRTSTKARAAARGNDGAMPLMVGNIVLLNSGSPPMTVKAITHAGQVLCQWIDSGGVLHEMELRPKCCRKSVKPRGQTGGTYPKNPIYRAIQLRARGKSARAPQTCGGSVGPSKETPSGPSKHAATKDRGTRRLGRRSNALKNPQSATPPPP